MKKETEKKVSEYIITLFFYFISLIISGVFRINSLVDVFDEEVYESIKLSAYIGLSTSSLFSIIVIILISLVAYFFIQIFSLKINTKSLINGIIVSIYGLIIFEIMRVILSFLFFDQAVNQLSDFDYIIEDLKTSQWYYYDSIIKSIMIIATGVIFCVSTIDKSKKYRDVFAVSIVIAIGFYISTLNIFNSI